MSVNSLTFLILVVVAFVSCSLFEIVAPVLGCCGCFGLNILRKVKPANKKTTGSGTGPKRGIDRSRRRKKPTTTPQVNKEVSQKEIQEKIKSTMARISSGGKNKRQKLRRNNRERHAVSS